MFEAISRKITNRMIKDGVIEQDELEIYLYGMELFFTTALNMLILIVLSIIFNEFWNGITFMLAFSFLRKYTGGYHASTPVKCCFLTMGVIFAMLLAVIYLKITVVASVIWLVLSAVIILLLSPMDSDNRQLDNIEKIIYGKMVMVVWGTEILFFILLQIFGFKELSISITYAHIIIGLSLIAGKIKAKIREQGG